MAGAASDLAGGRGSVVVATEPDATYLAYDEHPIDEPDEWGDLASFRAAAAAAT